jgi:hypothetical protein
MKRCDYLTNEGKRCKNDAVGTVRVGSSVDNVCAVHLKEFKSHHMLKPDKVKRFGR